MVHTVEKIPARDFIHLCFDSMMDSLRNDVYHLTKIKKIENVDDLKVIADSNQFIIAAYEAIPRFHDAWPIIAYFCCDKMREKIKQDNPDANFSKCEERLENGIKGAVTEVYFKSRIG